MSFCIETKRLILRGLGPGDMPFLIDLLGNPHVTRRLFAGMVMGPEEARKFIEQTFTFGEQGIGLGSLCEKRSQRVIGFSGFLACRYLGVDDFEFGVALEVESQAKGYAQEISLALIGHGLAHLPVTRLLALTHPENSAALKAIARMGMVFVDEIVIEQRGPRRIFRTAASGEKREGELDPT